MKILLTTALFLFASQTASAATMAPTTPISGAEKSILFTAQSGESTPAFEGSLTVPENRNDPASRKIVLRYVRFPSTAQNPGSPIVYLAGGPGGSGIDTAKRERFPLFLAMREFGDVIAFDQRGTGASNDLPNCTSSQVDPANANISDASYDLMNQSALRECLGFWRASGISVHGYNTRENAADLNALRRHLRARKISLLGISYGSHLAFAAIKQMERHIDKVVIASAEGLDQTIKLPAETDAYFGRLQEAINTQPATKQALPDIVTMVRRVHAKLEVEPLRLQMPTRAGGVRDYLWQRRDMQEMASAMIADPAQASLLLQVYAALDRGDSSVLLAVVPNAIPAQDAIVFRPMATLMDIASGTSSERRKLIETQAKTSLLGTYLNQSVTLEDVDPSLVMDSRFRAKPVSRVPLLLLSGTLDGRTYIESQREAVSGLSNRQTVVVKNAGHNLFMVSPEVTSTILAFMRGETVDGKTIDVMLPDLLTAGFGMRR